MSSKDGIGGGGNAMRMLFNGGDNPSCSTQEKGRRTYLLRIVRETGNMYLLK